MGGVLKHRPLAITPVNLNEDMKKLIDKDEFSGTPLSPDHPRWLGILNVLSLTSHMITSRDINSSNARRYFARTQRIARDKMVSVHSMAHIAD